MKQLFVLVLAALLSACGAQNDSPSVPAASATQTASAPAAQTQFFGSEVRDRKMGMNFSLPSTRGGKENLTDSQGKATVLVFGYTHCPDVCPTNLLTYGEVMKLLGEQAKEVQLYFITVDPERDTVPVLAQYVTIFHPDFVGLVPQEGAELDAVKQAWQITSRKVPHREGNYLVDHSTGTYLLDRNGETAIYEAHGTPAKQVAHDLQLLLQ